MNAEAARRPEPWGTPRALALAGFALLGLWLRVHNLAGEGLSDEEVRFGVLTPAPLVRGALALAQAVGSSRDWAPETVARLPSALAGALIVLAIAGLGRRVFGPRVALVAAALCACSTTLVGYQRLAGPGAWLGLAFVVAAWAVRAAVGEGLPAAGASRPKLLLRLALVGGALGVMSGLVNLLLGPWPAPPGGGFQFAGVVEPKAPLLLAPAFLVTKFGPATVALSVVGFGSLPRGRLGPEQLLAGAVLGLIIGSMTAFGRAQLIALVPLWCLLTARGLLWLAERLAPTELVPCAVLGLSVLVVGHELFSALLHREHPRLYLNRFGGGDRQVDWAFPGLDCTDIGFREVLRQVAKDAEPGAELSTFSPVLAAYTMDALDRHDLRLTPLRRDVACQGGTPCYVILQTGRETLANRDAVEHLAHHPLWFRDVANTRPMAQVYRLEPGEPAFPELPGK